MCRADFPYLQNSARLFFDTTALPVNCIVNSLFAILENFDIQKITERLHTNPNSKKQNEDYRFHFNMKFGFLHFASYFSIYFLNFLNFSKFSSKSHLILSLHYFSFIAILRKMCKQILGNFFLNTRKLPNQLK